MLHAYKFERSFDQDLPYPTNSKLLDYSTLLLEFGLTNNFNPSLYVHWSFSDPFGGVWIGLSDATSEGTFRWPDGSHATYTKWASSLSRNQNVNHDCVRMTVDKGAWDDTSCGKELPFVCEKKIYTAPWYELKLTEWKAKISTSL